MSDFDFEKISKAGGLCHEVQIAELQTLGGWKTTPILLCRPAILDMNPEYTRACIAWEATQLVGVDDLVDSDSRLAWVRRRDVDCYPENVVLAWKAMPVEFSVEACRKFLGGMPPWLFSRIRGELMSTSSFSNAEQYSPDLLARFAEKPASS